MKVGGGGGGGEGGKAMSGARAFRQRERERPKAEKRAMGLESKREEKLLSALSFSLVEAGIEAAPCSLSMTTVRREGGSSSTGRSRFYMEGATLQQ